MVTKENVNLIHNRESAKITNDASLIIVLMVSQIISFYISHSIKKKILPRFKKENRTKSEIPMF